MYEENVELDNGVAYNSENFDEDFTIGSSLFDDFSCDGVYEDCCWDESEVHLHCQCWKQCKEDYETI